VTFSSLHFADRKPALRLLLAALCAVVSLALILQGAHVCPAGESTTPGVWAGSSAVPFCPLCAIAQSLQVILLFFLIILVLTHTGIIFPISHARPCWRGSQLYVRPPPAF
jgi:hypothetical protein